MLLKAPVEHIQSHTGQLDLHATSYRPHTTWPKLCGHPNTEYGHQYAITDTISRLIETFTLCFQLLNYEDLLFFYMFYIVVNCL